MSDVQILFADDNQTNLYVMSRMLEIGQFRFETAVDGVEAIELALEHEPEVVLLDINMPRCDGVTAAKEIRRRLAGARPHLVAVSAAETMIRRDENDRAAFDHFLPKPVQIESLFALLRSLLDTPQREAAEPQRIYSGG